MIDYATKAHEVPETSKRCLSCGDTKALTMFSFVFGSRVHRCRHCHTCDITHAYEMEHKRKTHTIDTPEISRQCQICGETKVLEMFPLTGTCTTRRYEVCRHCFTSWRTLPKIPKVAIEEPQKKCRTCTKCEEKRAEDLFPFVDTFCQTRKKVCRMCLDFDGAPGYDPIRSRETIRYIMAGTGYVMVNGHKGHPNANKSGFIREHTLVMSLSIKRALRRRENVHHKNGIRDDNRLENLELWDYPQPPGQRQVDLIDWAINIIERHGTHPDLKNAMIRSLTGTVDRRCLE